MRRVLKVLGGVFAVLLVCVVGVYVWATFASGRLLAGTIDSHTVDFPIPFPVDEGEIADSAVDEAARTALAVERAVERGRHLVTARYACTECHGADFSGGVMVDAPIMGRILGPNITTGAGSRTLDYTAADWDRIVRHGILPDGRPAAMPSVDFELMSDQELSDIVAYIRSQPPVDNTVPPVTLGPLGRVLVATGQLPLSATLIASHNAQHEVVPPATEASEEFGRHLAGVCTGCHSANLAGGPIKGGDPSWPPARNLTPDPTGLAAWSYDDFVVAMRESRRPDGSELLPPMTGVASYARSMSDVELEAIWMYLRSVTPVAQ